MTTVDGKGALGQRAVGYIGIIGAILGLYRDYRGYIGVILGLNWGYMGIIGVIEGARGLRRRGAALPATKTGLVTPVRTKMDRIDEVGQGKDGLFRRIPEGVYIYICIYYVYIYIG